MKRKIISILTVQIMGFTVFAITPGKTSAASDTYWLKVNVQRNVVNVYKLKNGDWEPYRVMLCSCGKSGTRTPIGTFSVKKKWRWHKLMGSVSGQYVSQFYGNYLFHSVMYSKYKKPNKCIRSAYKKLGNNASHGCVRLAVMDAKWIYDNCSRGTKVTTYRSSNPGPLGKPSRVLMGGSGKTGWDPTDPNKNNKYFKLTGHVISIDKADTIEVGQEFNIKSGVTAKSPYTFQNLTSLVKVAKVEFQAYSDDPEATNPFVNVSSKTVDTSQAGTYIITYSCYSKYCGKNTVKKEFTLTVSAPPDPEEPIVDPDNPGEEPGNESLPAEENEGENTDETTDVIVEETPENQS